MSKRRLFVICFFVICTYSFFKCLFYFHLKTSDEKFTDISACPACYGGDLCPQFFHNDIVLSSGSNLKYFQFLNAKNVFYGKYRGERVVLKKLAHDWEIKEVDKALCHLAKFDISCCISDAVKQIVTESRENGGSFVDILRAFNSSTDLAKCPSNRLLSYIYDKLAFKSLHLVAASLDDQIAEMMYSISVNPESVIIQAFSQSEGWPFPAYKGSCGRVIVEENVGHPLLYFENSAWLQRLDLSYQLLQMAQLLTDNSLGFALYLTDVTMDNFAVRPDGTVMLIDVENIVIVDRQQIRRDKIGEWNKIYTNRGVACHDCLSYSSEDLCTHDVSDHNYYAICRGLLVPGAYYSSEGLLHSIPNEVDTTTNLSLLIKECAEPVSDKGRLIVVPKLLQIMKSLL